MIHDPRPQWDQKEPELDRREAELEHHVALSKKLDTQTIKATAERMANFTSARDAYRETRGELDEAITALRNAEAEYAEAQRTYQAGTTDPDTALANHSAFIIVEAKARALTAPIPDLIATCSGLRNRLSQVAFGSVDIVVITETRGLAKRLFEYDDDGESAYRAAEEAGRKLNAEKVACLALAEAVVREEYKPQFAQAKKDAQARDGKAGNPFFDHRRAETYYPEPDMLEEVYLRRRRAFEAERARVQLQLEALTGVLGGAR